MLSTPARQAGLGEDLAPQQAADERRLLRRLQHDGVAERERRGDRARRTGSAPRSTARSRRRRRPGGGCPSRASPDVGRDAPGRSAGTPSAGRLAEQARHEVQLEHRRSRTLAAGLAREQRDDLVAPAPRGGRRPSGRSAAARAGGVCAQRRERGRGGLDRRAARRRAPPAGDASRRLAGERVVVVEGAAVRRVDPLAADELPAAPHRQCMDRLIVALLRSTRSSRRSAQRR